MIKQIVFIILISLSLCIAQPDSIKIPALEYKTVIPGEEYEAGAVFRIFFGDHWRDLWTTPITVPVIDLGRCAGGLTPIKTGGGFQTKSLHFKGADGKFYKFRSINKDPSKLLPEDLLETFASYLLQDQISTSHPLSAVIAAPMLNAVGVLNSEPDIVILPDSPALGEYRDVYKNLLGIIAENPKDDTEEDLIFAGADKIKKLYGIFEELDENNKHQVDAPSYLKVRLMDIFLGDWDRHVGQWKWARYDEGDFEIWKPIPRDRDQAFSNYDGFFPWIASLAVTQIEHFDEDYPQINDMTWSGRHLDRRILMSVDKPTWDSVTTFVQGNLSDKVIEDAVKKMPVSWFDKEGQKLITTLKKRRDKLHHESLDYYEEISKYISIKTSNKAEYAEITRVKDDHVLVEIYDLDKENNKKAYPFYKRLFDEKFTSDIRVYLQGGDDKALVKGSVDESINVRVIGGSGADTLIDSSQVNGCFLFLLPIPDAENKTEFYDSGNKTNFVLSSGTSVDMSKTPQPKPYVEGDNVNEKYEPAVRDYGYDWKPDQWLNYTSDDGLQIGGGPILIRHGFRADPYVWKMIARYGYAFGAESNRVEYKSEFFKIIDGWRVDLNIGKSELGYNRFYGLGNETQFDKSLNADFYRVSHEFIYSEIYFHKRITDVLFLNFSTLIGNSDLKGGKNSIIATENFKGIGKNSYLSFGTGFVLDLRDEETNTKDGIYINANGQHTPEVFNNKDSYSKGILDFRFYYTPDFFPITLANRIYGEKIWGNYYLHDAATLGGSERLRGFTRERFTGDAAVLIASEIRMPLVKMGLIIPGILGISAHAESGRVFYDKNDSDIWHSSMGGGFWISYLEEAITLNLILSHSSEATQIYITTAFMF